MKRCPKCNRTFPDENQKFCTVDGGLLIADQVLDTNATIRTTTAELGIQPPETPRDNAATSRELPDLNAMVANSNAPTVAFPRNTGSAGVARAADLQSGLLGQSTLPGTSVHPQQVKKKSKLPLILAALVVLLLLGVAGLAGVFFYIINPRLEELRDRPILVRETRQGEDGNENSPAENTNNTNNSSDDTEAEAFVPPPDATKFANSKDNLDGKLAEHYIDFSFYYPKSWQTDPKAGVPGASNFVKVQKTLEDDTGDYLLESTTVSWYTSNGTFESDLSVFPERAKNFSSQLAGGLPGYEKVSEGATRINSLKGYEFRFKGVFQKTGKGDLPYWGRTIFLPSGLEREKNGIVIVMLATSLAPELSGVQDVGEKGEMPVILESFRFAEN